MLKSVSPGGVSRQVILDDNAIVKAIMKMRFRLSESPRRADSNNIDEFIVRVVVNELL
jgi:rRNA-processing protein FCF1